MSDERLDAYYGLPTEVVYCRRCIMSNQKPHSINETTHVAGSKKATMGVGDDGICDACRYSDAKQDSIDWEARERQLLRSLERFRRTDGSYDCIVSGSGGKDSMKIAHMLKYRYGMNPLTVTWAPHMYSDIGWLNMQRWIHEGGFDNLLFSANGKVMRKLTSLAFENLYFPFQPFKFGIKSWAAKMAMKFGIKLVMYGEPYAEYGSTTLEEADSPEVGWEFFVNDAPDVYLSGVHTDTLISDHGLSANDLLPFMPIRSHEVADHDIHVECLGWYMPWDPQESYYYAVENCGFEPETQRSEGTYGKYASIDDKIDGLHYWTHLIKFGIGRTSFDASHEVRNGHVTREEAVALWHKFEQEFPARFHADCLEYLGVTEERFQQVTDQFRSPHLWRQDPGTGVWRLRHTPDEVAQAPAAERGQSIISSSA